jgi:hypothetical protein
MRKFGSSGAVDIGPLPKSDLVPDSCHLVVRLKADMSQSLSSLNVNCKQRGAAQNRSDQSMKRRRMAMIRFEKDFDGFIIKKRRARKGYSNTFSALSSLSVHTRCSRPSPPGKVKGRDEATTRLSHHHPHPRNVRLASSKARLCRFAPPDMPKNLLRSLEPKSPRCRAVPHRQSPKKTHLLTVSTL